MSEELKAALARIACLEGEIAKRDAELAACRVAVENCDLFRARIAELESRYQRDVYGLNNEGDPIGGDPAGGYANDNARLRAELSAIKAQEPVARLPACPSRAFAVANLRDLAQSVLQHDPDVGMFRDEDQAFLINELADLAESFNGDVKFYAAPVSEAKAQGDAWAPSVNDYDHSIHSNPDAREWADFFVATFPGLADKHDLMIGWFANAMMAMHDHLARKAQGVVMPAELDRAFITGESCDGVYRVVIQSETLKEMQSVHRWLARLNAAPVQQDQAFCEYCGGNDEEPQDHCMDCTRPVQQVSVPDGWRLVPVEPTPKMIDATWYHETDMSCGIESQGARNKRIYEAMLTAAPAAPAADAGLVEALEKLARLGNGDKYGNSDGNLTAQAALAAHRAKGVV